MKYKTGKRVKVVTASTGPEFETCLNEALSEIAGGRRTYDIVYNTNVPGHCAYITYDHTEEIPETPKEELELRGERYYCRECPHFVPSMDGRTTRTMCPFLGERVTSRSDCCEWFYRALIKGEVKPVETTFY